MKSLKNGTDTLTNSVTAISEFGFWIICENKEYFITFNDYPVFKKVRVDKIFNLKFISPKQMYWPEIDIDIEVEALEKPNMFPLIYK